MVIAAVIVGRQLALRVDGPAEFARPNDECVVQQAVILQVLNQPRVGLVGLLGVDANILRQPRVMIPGPMIELYEPDAPLSKTQVHKTVSLLRSRYFRIR